MQELGAEILVDVSGTISRVIGLSAMLVAVVALIYDGRLRPFSVVHGVIVLFLAWSCLTYLWSSEPAATYARLLTNVQLLFMVFLFAQFASREDESVGLIAAYVFGASVSVVALLFQLSTGVGLMNQVFMERFTAWGNNPNDFALAIALGIPMAWFLATRRVSLFTTLMGYGFVVIGPAGVILTGSRGGLLAAIAGAMILPISIFRLGRRDKIAAVVICIVAAVVAIRMTPDLVWATLASIETVMEEVPSSEMDGVNIRTVIWSAGLTEFVSNAQAASIGLGAGAYRYGVNPLYGEKFVAHNSFISILLELGVIGMAMFVALLYMLLSSLRYLPKPERMMWTFVLLTWAVGVCFMTWEHTKNTWFVFGVLAARLVSARHASENKPGFLASLFGRTRIGLRLRRPIY